VPGYEETAPEPFDPVERQRAYWSEEQAKRAEEKKNAKLAAMPVKTPEEIEAEAIEKLRRLREYHRKYQREWQHRRKEHEDLIAAISKYITPPSLVSITGGGGKT
jgi:hypothetical protein